jgi:hypothetical protein
MMTEENATKVANVVLAAAAVAAAYVVIRTPALRRLATGLVIAGMTGTVPAWVNREVREAWDASGRAESRGAARQRSALS